MIELQNQFLSYELALQIQQLGFNKKCLAFYSLGKSTVVLNNDLYSIDSTDIGAPLFQQALEWFMEKGFQISLWTNPENPDAYIYEVMYQGRFIFEHNKYIPYHEAKVSCIEKLIEVTKSL